MKPYLTALAGLGLLLNASCMVTSDMSAQTPPPVTVVAPPGPADEMEQLVAPIALYPDVLVALILPAATESADVVLAARHLASGGSADKIDEQPWDDDVKGLARYPEVVKWMDENLAWTQQMGDAYLANPENVMAAVQRARARALANGVLASNAQHQVIVEDGIIRIVPAQEQVVYIPRYDPEIIYVERPVYYTPGTWITFSSGFGIGWWLRNDCDWHRRVIVVDRRPREHWQHHQWRHHHFTHRPGHRFDDHDWKPWMPRPGHPRHRHPGFGRPPREIVRPTPMPGSPGRDRDRHADWRDRDGRQDTRDRDVTHRRPGAPSNSNPAFGPTRGVGPRPPVVDNRADADHRAGDWRRAGGGRRENRQPESVTSNPAPAPVVTNPNHNRPSDHRPGDWRRAGGGRGENRAPGTVTNNVTNNNDSGSRPPRPERSRDRIHTPPVTQVNPEMPRQFNRPPRPSAPSPTPPAVHAPPVRSAPVVNTAPPVARPAPEVRREPPVERTRSFGPERGASPVVRDVAPSRSDDHRSGGGRGGDDDRRSGGGGGRNGRRDAITQ